MRTKLENGKRIPLTAEEEDQRDAEEAAYLAAAPDRELESKRETISKDIAAEFKKLNKNQRKKWYKNGVKGQVREALQDGEIEIAMELIDEQTSNGAGEDTAKSNMLALLSALIPT